MHLYAIFDAMLYLAYVVTKLCANYGHGLLFFPTLQGLGLEKVSEIPLKVDLFSFFNVNSHLASLLCYFHAYKRIWSPSFILYYQR